MAERIRMSDLVRNVWLALANRLRLLHRRGMDYIVLRISGSYPERTLQPRRPFPLSLLPWPPSPPSVEAFNRVLDRVAIDPRVKGIVLLISGLSAEPATLGSLRQAVGRFRRSGKQTVAYLDELNMWSYYLASACHQVVAPESADFHAAGLRSEAVFLRDTLALAGIEADFEAFAEYKVSPDSFRRARMTEPHREMLESLLDSLYTHILSTIADGRGTSPDRIEELLDSVPLTAAQAHDAGLLDAVCYEDELAAHLGSGGEPAALLTWDQAQRRLIRPRPWYSRFCLGVISLEGLIVPGPSRRPPLPLPLPLPLPATQAGSDTLVQQLRAAAQNKSLAAVVLHVDSPGGSALASDLIWREVARLRRLKPVVVYMSNVAASGGYYVSAPANAIVAQPMTLTGSIGIWGGKIVTRGLYEKIRAGREVVSRGKVAGLYAETAPFSEEERAKIRADIGAGYVRFKARVAAGRGMTDEGVEAIARGRVWTGEQALAHGLVDQQGDLQAAAEKARELAGMDPRRYVPLIPVPPPKRYQLPQPAAIEAGEWLAGLSRLLHEKVFALAPWQVRFRG
jgi:protease IV